MNAREALNSAVTALEKMGFVIIPRAKWEANYKEMAALREAAREAVNCITHHAEDNENTRWVLSLLNTALAQGADDEWSVAERG